MKWGKKWLASSNAGKAQLDFFYWPNNTCAIDVKKARSVLEKKSIKINWIGAFLLSVLIKLLPRKSES